MTRVELTDWLVAAENRYGGVVSNIPKRKASVHDRRTREEWSAVRMMGGDRMSPAHHGYAPKYAEYLEGLASDRERRITLVEVGVLRGTGLAVWADLFPKARIIGLDLDTSYFDENVTALRSLNAFRNEPEVVEFDQLGATPGQFMALLRGDSIDVMIDDGSHRMEAIMRTLAAAMPHLARRFVYFVEDNAAVHKEISRTYPYLHVEACGELTVLTPGPLFHLRRALAAKRQRARARSPIMPGMGIY